MNITFETLTSQHVKRDPIGFFVKWRSHATVGHVTGSSGDIWVAFDYKDAVEVLCGPGFIKDRNALSVTSPGETNLGQPTLVPQAWQRNMLRSDPPDHRRLRGTISRAFTARTVAGLRDSIEQITHELLNDMADANEMDLIEDLAHPLPIRVLCDMLGIPEDERSEFRSRARTLVVVPESVEEEAANINSVLSYLADLAQRKRREGGQDLTTELVRIADSGDDMSESELASMLWLLVLGGYETTTNLIGNGMLALLQHPAQLQRLREDPSLIPSAVEEMLRYGSPMILSTPRWVAEDRTLHGAQLRTGDMVFASLVAANIDPAIFPEPLQFDIGRQNNRHLAFGRGIHYCLGAPLARLEGAIAFRALLDRLPTLEAACDLEHLAFVPNLLARGLVTLPVKAA